MTDIESRNEKGPGLAPVPDESTERTGMPRLVRGFSWLALAQVAGQVIGLAVLAIVVRRIGQANFGAYQFAAALTAYFAIPMNFGFETAGMREIAQSPSKTGEIIREILAIQLGFGVAAYAALVLLSGPLGADETASRLIPLVALSIIVYGLSLEWALAARREMLPLAGTRLAGQIAYGVVTPLVLIGGVAGAERYALCNVFGILVTALAATLLVWRRVGRLLPKLSVATLGRRLRESLPLGVSVAATQGYSKIDILMLGYIGSTSAVGIYAVAYKLPLALTALATQWVFTFFPYLSDISVSSPSRIAKELGNACTMALVVCTPMVVIAGLLAAPLMTTFFGSGFHSAGTPFAILTVAAGIILVSANPINALVAAGDERRFAAVATVAIIVNVGACVVLIPPYGATGGAIATVVTEVFIFIYAARRAVGLFGPFRPDWNRVVRGLAAGLPMAGVIVALSGATSIWVRLGAGMATYFLFALPLRVVTRSELRLLRRG